MVFISGGCSTQCKGGIGSRHCCICFSGRGIVGGKAIGADFTYHDEEKEIKIASLKEFAKSYIGIKQAAGIILVALIAAAIPSQRTIYLIAASEVGQNVVESKVGDDLYQKINRYLEIQLGDLETKKSQ